MKKRVSLKSVKPSAFGAEGSVGLSNLPNLLFSEFRSKKHINSESTKSTFSAFGANQTHPYNNPFAFTLTHLRQTSLTSNQSINSICWIDQLECTI